MSDLTALRISATRIAEIMAVQFKVWGHTPHADEVIVDCCHGLATALGLTQKQRDKFLRQCRYGNKRKGQ